MIRILGISGSLRQASFNTALLRAAQRAAGAGARFELATLHGIPLYDGDLEKREGLPAAVVALKESVVAADGVLLATPEYNNGVPGVMKNAIDWLSRPADDIPRVFGGRPFALCGASPGAFGTVLSQNGWLPVLRLLGVQLWASGRLLVPRAGQAFDAEGALVDEAARERLGKFVAGFLDFVQRQAAGPASPGPRQARQNSTVSRP